MGSDRGQQGKAGPRHPVRAAGPSPWDGHPTGAECEVCGKGGDHCFEVHLGGERHIFDSFECAIRGLMPICPLCGCMILGSGVQVGDQLYCSHACASLTSVVEVEVHSRVVQRRKY